MTIEEIRKRILERAHREASDRDVKRYLKQSYKKAAKQAVARIAIRKENAHEQE